jgi:hypothetical protein
VQKKPNFRTRKILFCILSGEQLSQGFVHVHLTVYPGKRNWGWVTGGGALVRTG